LGIHLPPRENSVWNQDCEIFCDDCLHR
jgi:hypothetical protein